MLLCEKTNDGKCYLYMIIYIVENDIEYLTHNSLNININIHIKTQSLINF